MCSWSWSHGRLSVFCAPPTKEIEEKN
jgi:hypothetical protein